MEKQHTLSMADRVCDLGARKIKQPFFTQMNSLIDWSFVELLTEQHYQKGNCAVDNPSYSG